MATAMKIKSLKGPHINIYNVYIYIYVYVQDFKLKDLAYTDA